MLYEIIKYVRKHGMGISIDYYSASDFVKITVYKTNGVSRYGKTLTIYGIEGVNPEPGDIVTGQVKEMVDELKKGGKGVNV